MSTITVMYMMLKKVKEPGKGKGKVTILPDSGMKYLSADLYEDE